MSSFETNFAHTFDNLVDKTINTVEGFVNQTADNVSDFLTGNRTVINQSTTSSTSNMGSTSSKTSHSSKSSTTTRATTNNIPVIPQFFVAYGLNSAGKTALYPINIAKEFPGRNQNEITVGDLQNYLAGITKVPVESQKLIHKGNHLRSETTLVSLAIRDGGKIMMLGSVPPDPDEKYKKALSTLEDEISVVSMQVMDIQLQLESCEPTSQRALHKQLLLANEQYMKILMKVDSVEIPAERIDARAARKAVVLKIHSEMEVVDKLAAKYSPEPAQSHGNDISEKEVVFQDSR